MNAKKALFLSLSVVTLCMVIFAGQLDARRGRGGRGGRRMHRHGRRYHGGHWRRRPYRRGGLSFGIGFGGYPYYGYGYPYRGYYDEPVYVERVPANETIATLTERTETELKDGRVRVRECKTVGGKTSCKTFIEKAESV